MRRPWVPLLLILGVAAAWVAVRTLVGGDFEPKILVQRLRELGTDGWALPAYGALYVLTTSALLPAAVLHVAAGATWGFWGAFWPSLILVNLVGHLHFWIGRWLGGERMRALLIRRGWTAPLEELEHSGVFTVLVLRQTPVPFVVTNMVCGASPVTWPQFFIGHLIGVMPGLLVNLWFASALADGVEGAKEQALVRLAIVGGTVVLAAIGLRLGVAALRKRRMVALAAAAQGAEGQRTSPT